MNGNNIEYITHKIINGDVTLVPTQKWHNNIESELRNTWLPRVGSFEDVVTAISYKKDAAYYTLFRKVQTSRDGDFQFVCVHVPYFMELDMDTLVAALEKIKGYVKENEIQAPEDSVVEGIVSEIKVTNNNIVPPTSYMRGDGYAYRRIGGDLHYKYADIIKGQNQSEYNQYGVIFVLGENMSAVGIEDNANLSDKVINSHVWFSKSELKGLEDGVSVYYGDKPLDGPILVESKDQIELTFKKEGFLDQRIKISVTDGSVGNLVWRVNVTKEMFDVRDEKTNKPILSPVRIYINDDEIPYELEESKMKVSQNVKVKAKGFEPYDKKCQIEVGKTIDIKLKKKPIECYISIGENTNTKIKFLDDEIQEKCCSGNSPIPGYKVDFKKLSPNILLIPESSGKKSPSEPGPSVLKKILKVFLPILIMLIAFVAGFVVGNKHLGRDNSQRIDGQETIVEDIQAQETATPILSSGEIDKQQKSEDLKEIANKYLSGHDVWNRDEMEKIELLKGVWDAMNTYNYKAIKKADNDYHFEAQKWQDLIKAITDGSAKPRETNSSYCVAPNDFDITVAAYINVIKESPKGTGSTSSSKPSNSSSTRTGSRSTNTKINSNTQTNDSFEGKN